MSNLLKESEVYRPFSYPWALELTDKHDNVHWHPNEIELSDDLAQWNDGTLSEQDKNHIIQTLRLFTQSDVAVGANYYNLFIPRFKNNEVRNMLGGFASRESIHQRAYARLNDTLGLPEEEYSAFLSYKEMADKMEFMTENDPSTLSGLGLCLAKSVFSEGVTLFASFIMLLNYSRFGKMNGMCTVVEWSVRDESIHVEGNSKLFKTYCEEHKRIVNDEFKTKIYDMARKVVELEDKFIDLAYAMGEAKDLTKDGVKQYIRYITDRRLIQLGLKPNFGVKDNPLPWTAEILSGVDHSNFFEKRVTEYSVSSLRGDWVYPKTF